MVITVEPGGYKLSSSSSCRIYRDQGLYVPPTPQFPKCYHNMGIRIEVRLDP